MATIRHDVRNTLPGLVLAAAVSLFLAAAHSTATAGTPLPVGGDDSSAPAPCLLPDVSACICGKSHITVAAWMFVVGAACGIGCASAMSQPLTPPSTLFATLAWFMSRLHSASEPAGAMFSHEKLFCSPAAGTGDTVAVECSGSSGSTVADDLGIRADHPRYTSDFCGGPSLAEYPVPAARVSADASSQTHPLPPSAPSGPPEPPQPSGRRQSNAEDEELKRVLHAVTRSVNDLDGVWVTGWLGQGASSSVFRAQWGSTELALKVCRSGKRLAQDQFLTEARIGIYARHPNVVATYKYSLQRKAYERKAGWRKSSRTSHTSTSERLSFQGSNSTDCDSVRVIAAAASQMDAPLDGWELRLLQEFCDFGTLQSALKSGAFLDDEECLPEFEAAPGTDVNNENCDENGDDALKHATQINDSSGKAEASFSLTSQQTLPKLLPTSRQDIHSVLALAENIVDGMIYLHDCNILHGDLKLSNVFLKSIIIDGSQGVQAKVGDFGLSVFLNHGEISRRLCGGTPSHMAPEALTKFTVCKASDVYSFGILLFELATGERPYMKMSREELIHRVTSEDLRPQIVQPLPRQLVELMKHCWSRDPHARPTFGDVKAALKDIRSSLSNMDGRNGCRPTGQCQVPTAKIRPSNPRLPVKRTVSESVAIGAKTHFDGSTSSADHVYNQTPIPPQAQTSTDSSTHECAGNASSDSRRVRLRNRIKSMSWLLKIKSNQEAQQQSRAGFLQSMKRALSGSGGNSQPRTGNSLAGTASKNATCTDRHGLATATASGLEYYFSRDTQSEECIAGHAMEVARSAGEPRPHSVAGSILSDTKLPSKRDAAPDSNSSQGLMSPRSPRHIPDGPLSLIAEDHVECYDQSVIDNPPAESHGILRVSAGKVEQDLRLQSAPASEMACFQDLESWAKALVPSKRQPQSSAQRSCEGAPLPWADSSLTDLSLQEWVNGLSRTGSFWSSKTKAAASQSLRHRSFDSDRPATTDSGKGLRAAVLCRNTFIASAGIAHSNAPARSSSPGLLRPATLNNTITMSEATSAFPESSEAQDTGLGVDRKAFDSLSVRNVATLPRLGSSPLQRYLSNIPDRQEIIDPEQEDSSSSEDFGSTESSIIMKQLPNGRISLGDEELESQL